MLEGFIQFMKDDGASSKTVEQYTGNVKRYMQWFEESFGKKMELLYKSNILDFKSYLLNNLELSAKTVNSYLFALSSYNIYLMVSELQKEKVIDTEDRMKIQTNYVCPSIIDKKDVDEFRQRILEGQGIRDYAIVTLLAYAGPRISEVINMKLSRLDLPNREVVVVGKGDKERCIQLNSKIVDALREYFKIRRTESPYVFVSRQSDHLCRSRVNQICNKYSDIITPHLLRHFYCTRALEAGFSISDVAYQAGHASTKTTQIYTNPSKKELKKKAELL